MHQQSFGQMTSENVENFEIRIIDAQDLIVSIVLVHAPWIVTAEQYQIGQEGQ